eukprot:TRINITY_DN29021_c0_g1_i1.p2 TRINITY_DN29021_c0_g1~~TRINITY_DN29021_c0_g1_i1.p2  ORF type:complete len:109 (+),score=30.50 TRINITY_DN29021_c0_g1_i1:144-470(+)
MKKRAEAQEVVDELLEDQRSVRNDLYRQANEEYEAELKRYKGTREEQIAQLNAAREREDMFIRFKEWLYFALYRAKSILPFYFMFLVVAFYLYSITFMRSMDRALTHY